MLKGNSQLFSLECNDIVERIEEIINALKLPENFTNIGNWYINQVQCKKNGRGDMTMSSVTSDIKRHQNLQVKNGKSGLKLFGVLQT